MVSSPNKNTAIIPARGGSERIPNKNIKDFLGKPVISYSIKAALDSCVFDNVIVSTDCEKTAQVAREAGAEVPFMRPESLADDRVPIVEVVHHAITFLKERGDEIAYVCCILATAPFLQPGFLLKGLQLIRERDVDSVITVARFPSCVHRAFKVTDQGRIVLLWPEHEFSISKDLTETFYDAGQFWWANVETFLLTKSAMGQEVLPIVLPGYLVRDIDTPEDWEMAEIMYEVCKRKGLL